MRVPSSNGCETGNEIFTFLARIFSYFFFFFQVRLRVVREFGLNECALAVLENSSKFYNFLTSERPTSQLDRPQGYMCFGGDSFRASASKRRFRSEPGLAQVRLKNVLFFKLIAKIFTLFVFL